ncbi:hypothetical protein [Pseudomonas abietaniphila]|uniref:hypothetical protein n=1 Tax=Pseudomonas abietaniphila TaxID=89065 RepID=UPI000785C7E3|nr:hypothetical protein [Pseudomonas abietaniphila]
MPISALLHLECDPVEPIDAVKHSVFTCLQWRSSNLDLMPKAGMLRFAVMYDEALENYVIKALEEAYLRGALFPVKLVAVRDDEIHLFLDSNVASSTIPAIKSLWVDVAEADQSQPWHVSFSNEAEVYTGRSDFDAWEDAKDILESYALGFEDYELPTTDHESYAGVVAEKAGNDRLVTSAKHPEPEESQRFMSFEQCLSRLASDCSATPKRKTMRPELLSMSQLSDLRDAIPLAKSLRDVCLRTIAMEGVRAIQIASLKLGSQISSPNGGRLTLPSKVRQAADKSSFALSTESFDLITEYVNESGLCAGDYLFPSVFDTSRPISPMEMQAAFQVWLADAKIKAPIAGISIIRTSAAYYFNALSSAIDWAGHHTQPRVIEYYLKTRPDAV